METGIKRHEIREKGTRGWFLLATTVVSALAAGGCSSAKTSEGTEGALVSTTQTSPGGIGASAVPQTEPVNHGSIPPCANGTVASYLGTSCSQPSTVFHWTGYTCTSTPTSICSTLGVNGANINMDMDPLGANTILVGDTSLWNVAAGQSVDVLISGTVYGADGNGNWPHFNHDKRGTLVGQTGDGTEENITTVGCGATSNCIGSNNGVSDILCSATSPKTNCLDQHSIIPFENYSAHFNPAPAASPDPLTIEVKLNGGTDGSATLYSVGIHVGVPLR